MRVQLEGAKAKALREALKANEKQAEMEAQLQAEADADKERLQGDIEKAVIEAKKESDLKDKAELEAEALR